MQLYEITNEYQQAFDAMQNMDISEQELEDSLAGIKSSFEDKAKNLAAYILNIELEADQVELAEKTIKERLQARKKSLDSKANYFRNYLLKNMQACDFFTLKTNEFKISIKKNPAKLIVSNESSLPQEYIQVIMPDPYLLVMKDKIKNDLKEGKEVNGAHLEQNFRVEIK